MAEIRFYRLGSTGTEPFALDVSRQNTLSQVLDLVMSRAPSDFRPQRIHFIVNGTRVFSTDLDKPAPYKVSHVVIRETETRAAPASNKKEVFVID